MGAHAPASIGGPDSDLARLDGRHLLLWAVSRDGGQVTRHQQRSDGEGGGGQGQGVAHILLYHSKVNQGCGILKAIKKRNPHSVHPPPRLNTTLTPPPTLNTTFSPPPTLNTTLTPPLKL